MTSDNQVDGTPDFPTPVRAVFRGADAGVES